LYGSAKADSDCDCDPDSDTDPDGTVFSSLVDAAKCQPTYELIGLMYGQNSPQYRKSVSWLQASDGDQ
jgi:hypothetical protein